MSYILAFRNPRTKKLSVITDDNGNVEEFETEAAATQTAGNTMACRAWGYEIVEIGK